MTTEPQEEEVFKFFFTRLFNYNNILLYFIKLSPKLKPFSILYYVQ